MFSQISLSPQVKGYEITTYKHDIYELPHELSNDLRLLSKMKISLILAKNSWKTETKLFP